MATPHCVVATVVRPWRVELPARAGVAPHFRSFSLLPSNMMSFPRLLVLLSASTVAAVVDASLPFELGKPTFFGSGCRKDTVAVVQSSDGKTLSVLFSEFAASTSADRPREYKACNLAVPLDVSPGFTVAVTQVDYRGNAFVPNTTGAEAQFSASYFFAGSQGPQSKRSFAPGFDGDVLVSDAVVAATWAPCGASTIFRVNAGVVARKSDAGAQGDVQIAIDSADGRLGGFHYSVQVKSC